jgi:hypothetical protein
LRVADVDGAFHTSVRDRLVALIEGREGQALEAFRSAYPYGAVPTSAGLDLIALQVAGLGTCGGTCCYVVKVVGCAVRVARMSNGANDFVC